VRGLLEHGDRGLVSGACAPLEVMRALRELRAARLQRGRDARMRGEAPALASRLVDRAAHDRVAKAIAARYLRTAQQVGGQQLIQHGQRSRLVEVGGGDRLVELDGLARHRCPLGQAAGGLAERGDLVRKRGRHRPRDLAERLGGRGRRRAGRCPARELLEVERVAPALLEDLHPRAGVQGVAQEEVGLLGRQRERRQLDGTTTAGRRLQRPRQPDGQLPGPERHRKQHGRTRRTAQEVREELMRRVVCPVQVVERDHDGALARQRVQQAADGTVHEVALVGQERGLRVGAGGHDGQYPRELTDAIAEHSCQPLVAKRSGVVVESVDPHPERDVALELRSSPGEHEIPTRIRARTQLVKQARLTDPRLAVDPQRGAA